ncbi:MAG: hypothetical protein Q8K32_10950 [Archangium sp.]|nr:hypothetical protein [Archangium sp.]
MSTAAEALETVESLRAELDAVTAERDAAREEQREACALAVAAIGQCEQHSHECEVDRTVDEAFDRVRATPLTATPLAAERDAARDALNRKGMSVTPDLDMMRLLARAEAAEARVKELEAKLALQNERQHFLDGSADIANLQHERDQLRAELAAERERHVATAKERDRKHAAIYDVMGQQHVMKHAIGFIGRWGDDPAFLDPVQRKAEVSRVEEAITEWHRRLVAAVNPAALSAAKEDGT